ncbi:uncharacterized protein EV420DRAFT_38778 [Desarmillaria tabescens]|uniref:Uncharacterized protein n=1 Tax=Armillaria tabescens TaxID=1929756 RepID=A0AA39NQ22_ARMTA|nr:uncharacterized protein EV420DRAFT_38778 [Desarmillaria tabescens]KAK0469519.1 hypothetical protein EV420DRAFT_38778 [Desarmillaria tabescens]
MQSPIQLITSAILHLYAYIQRLFFYISTVTRPSRLTRSNDTPFLYDSGMSLNDLERGLQDLQPTTYSQQDRCQSVMDISCANSKVSTNVSRPSSTTECEPHISHFVKHRDTLDSTKSSDALRRRSYSLSYFSPPEPRIHQRKRSSTVWFKKPATTGDYKRFSDYDDGDDTNVVARVRRAIEECAEEEDVRAIFDRRSAWDTIKSVVIDEDAILEETEDSFSMCSSSVPSTPVPPSQSESTQGLEFAKTSDTSELAYTNQDSAMVSSVSTFVTGFPTYKSLDNVLAALALQSTGEVSWSDLVSFSEGNCIEILEEGKVVSHANGFGSARSDVPWSDLLSLEPYDG